ncbi:MAG: hypothetical protein IJ927_06345 [Eubacterium sp.]|nr:hypothetical protein [Eubacterium sp.]
MVYDMLNEVLRKEEETAKNEQEARARADEIIKNAETQAKAIIENAKKTALENSDGAVENAKSKADEQIRNAEQDARNIAEGLKEKSASMLSQATGAVKDIILK